MIKIIMLMILLTSPVILAFESKKNTGIIIGAGLIGGLIGRKIAPIRPCKLGVQIDPIMAYTLQSINHFDNKITKFKWATNCAIGSSFTAYAYLTLSNKKNHLMN